MRALKKLAEKVDGQLRIKSDPPVLIPLRDLPAGDNPDELGSEVESTFAKYKETLADNRKVLIDKYHIVDIALKVVGVGSVGTRCLVALFVANDDSDPLFLQIKEATESRAWKLISRRARTPSTVSVSSGASASCKSRATSSSAGRSEPGVTRTTGVSSTT